MSEFQKYVQQIEELKDLLCLADDLLMTSIGAFPLPGNPLRDDCVRIRNRTGSDYGERKIRADRARKMVPGDRTSESM